MLQLLQTLRTLLLRHNEIEKIDADLACSDYDAADEEEEGEARIAAATSRKRLSVRRNATTERRKRLGRRMKSMSSRMDLFDANVAVDRGDHKKQLREIEDSVASASRDILLLAQNSRREAVALKLLIATDEDKKEDTSGSGMSNFMTLLATLHSRIKESVMCPFGEYTKTVETL